MDLGLHAKIILVSGGAQGIGAAISCAFASEGAIPMILDRDEPAASRLIARLGTGHVFPLELTDESALRQTVAEIMARFGRIDAVINNAGVNDSVALDHPPADFLQSLHRNLAHVFTLTHLARPALIASRGSIVNIGSKVATTGQGGTSGYAAAKGAINALTREWAVELAPHGIRVNCVCPAEVLTPQYERWLQTLPDPASTRRRLESAIPLGQRFTSPEEIASLVVFLASTQSSHTTGQILYPDGGYTHLDRAATRDSP